MEVHFVLCEVRPETIYNVD